MPPRPAYGKSNRLTQTKMPMYSPFFVLKMIALRSSTGGARHHDPLLSMIMRPSSASHGVLLSWASVDAFLDVDLPPHCPPAQQPHHHGPLLIISSTCLCAPGGNQSYQTIRPVSMYHPRRSDAPPSSGVLSLPIIERDINATIDATPETRPESDDVETSTSTSTFSSSFERLGA